MPTIAIRTINLENVRFDRKVILWAIKVAKLNATSFFVTSQICGFTVKRATF